MTTNPSETLIVKEKNVSCDGGEGALGHPRVFLTLDNAEGDIECPYCDRRFVLDGSEAAKLAQASH
jgi:uncharacterized Zn-finger protein